MSTMANPEDSDGIFAPSPASSPVNKAKRNIKTPTGISNNSTNKMTRLKSSEDLGEDDRDRQTTNNTNKQSRSRNGDETTELSADSNAYEKVRMLGRGGFGMVHLVKHSDTKRLFALKVIKHGETKEEKQRAMQEVRLMQMLNHPCVTKLNEAFVSSDSKGICLVMSYCESGDLARAIKLAREGVAFTATGGGDGSSGGSGSGQLSQPKPFGEAVVLRWFAQVCLGMQYLHGLQMLHRDLKPSNIFLGESGALVRIGDFGLAKVFDVAGGIETATAEVGTPYYTSPEMVSSRPYSFPSDVWSLGIILFELLALETPFRNHDMVVLVKDVVSRNPPPLSEQYSADVKLICTWMLQKSPDRRPTMLQLLSTPLMRKHSKQFVDSYNPMQGEHRERINFAKDLKAQLDEIERQAIMTPATISELLAIPDPAQQELGAALTAAAGWGGGGGGGDNTPNSAGGNGLSATLGGDSQPNSRTSTANTTNRHLTPTRSAATMGRFSPKPASSSMLWRTSEPRAPDSSSLAGTVGSNSGSLGLPCLSIPARNVRSPSVVEISLDLIRESDNHPRSPGGGHGGSPGSHASSTTPTIHTPGSPGHPAIIISVGSVVGQSSPKGSERGVGQRSGSCDSDQKTQGGPRPSGSNGVSLEIMGHRSSKHRRSSVADQSQKEDHKDRPPNLTITATTSLSNSIGPSTPNSRNHLGHSESTASNTGSSSGFLPILSDKPSSPHHPHYQIHHTSSPRPASPSLLPILPQAAANPSSESPPDHGG